MPIRSFRADQIEADWYIRAMRAHANCVENLPVFGAIVLGLYVGNVASAFVNAWAVAVLVARIMQSLVHVCFVQTNAVACVRARQFSVVDRDPADQAEWKRITTGSRRQ
jgi:uncharacterized MAPEG superfamily protein